MNKYPADRENETQALQRERERMQFVIDGAGLGTWEWNMQTNQTAFNEAWAGLLGYSLDELFPCTFETWANLVHPDDLVRAQELLRRCAAGEIDTYDCEIRMRHKDGHWVWLLDRGRIMIRDAGGAPLLMFGMHTDISARKRVEEALRLSQERLDLAMGVANDGVWDWDLTTDTAFFDARYFTMCGYEPNEFPHRFDEWSQRLHPEDLEACVKAIHEHLAGKTAIFDIEFRFRRKDGSYMWIRGRGKIVTWDSAGKPKRMIGTHTDVTERRRAEEALRRSEKRFQSMLGLIPDMISIQDPEMTILYCNWQGFADVPVDRRQVDTKCYRTLRGLDAVCPDCLARSVLETSKPVQKEVCLADGRWVDVRIIPLLDANGRVELFMEWVRDITEQKRTIQERERLQAQLAQAQKMESIGRLAGGVAHDFNNMLSVILGHSEMALATLDSSHSLHDAISEIRKAAERSAGFTRQLLAFARKQTVAPRVLDLNETVEGMLAMLRRLIGEDIDLAWRPRELIGAVKIDPTQIDQILANLCVNARDAIENTGKITIETGNASFDAAFCAMHPEIQPGDYIVLAVSDNGCGIGRDALPHLFEPFFTTKEIGKGTGLGLATVYGIVKQNNGFINVYSEPGEGSTFKIYIPRYNGATAPAQRPASIGGHPSGRATILLVEDEPAILTMTELMLEKEGYTVLTAATPQSALSVAQEHPGQIDLLITDVVMPGMNGRDLARQLKSSQPRLRCAFMSGYTANTIAHHGVLDEGVLFIQKPFTGSDLFALIRQALAKPNPEN